MKRIIFIGRSECGKTTLSQMIRGEQISYQKTQHISLSDCVIDTPGEYAQVSSLAHALGLYVYEADVVGLCCASNEPFCLFPPCSTSSCNREVIGIVTKTDLPDGDPEKVERWLNLAGCKTVYRVTALDSDSIIPILEHLNAVPFELCI